jgi:hypothetical protein
VVFLFILFIGMSSFSDVHGLAITRKTFPVRQRIEILLLQTTFGHLDTCILFILYDIYFYETEI